MMTDEQIKLLKEIMLEITEKICNKLEEIRCGLIDIETNMEKKDG